MAAIQALEVRSKEFEREKREKAILEAKIKALTSQVLIGGEAMEDSPAFQFALEEKQRLIRQEYEDKLGELEKERKQLEDNKVHIERYKHLLLKQRDIMLNMTQRLNERDESIISMQKELAVNEAKMGKISRLLVQGTSRIKTLERILNQNGIKLPETTANSTVSESNHNNYNFMAASSDDAPLTGPLLSSSTSYQKKKVGGFTYESPLKIGEAGGARSVSGRKNYYLHDDHQYYQHGQHGRSKSPHEIVLRNAPWTADTVERNNRTTTSGLEKDDEDFYGNNFEYNSSELEQYRETSSPSRSGAGGVNGGFRLANMSDNNTHSAASGC